MLPLDSYCWQVQLNDLSSVFKLQSSCEKDLNELGVLYEIEILVGVDYFALIIRLL